MNEARTILNVTVAFLGWFFGYLISLASSLALFQLFHHPSYLPASVGYMTFTAIYGILFAILAGMVGGSICRVHAHGVGIAIGLTIAILAIYSWYSDSGSHWSQGIALVFMAPAAWLGGWLRRIPDSELS